VIRSPNSIRFPLMIGSVWFHDAKNGCMWVFLAGITGAIMNVLSFSHPHVKSLEIGLWSFPTDKQGLNKRRWKREIFEKFKSNQSKRQVAPTNSEIALTPISILSSGSLTNVILMCCSPPLPKNEPGIATTFFLLRSL
jgi:hypothetical protein